MIDDRGIKVPIFSEPVTPDIYRREISTTTFFSSNPKLRDPYESRTVQVRSSCVAGGGSGLFSRARVSPNRVLSFYNGRRIEPKDWVDWDNLDWAENAYKIFDPAIKNGTIDIPPEYRSEDAYCASLAHKTNHSFLPNAEFVSFEHPRFGIVPCLVSTHDIEKDEEIFVHYGYDLGNSPEWYEQAWLKGDYPVPDSMREEYCVGVKKDDEDQVEEVNGGQDDEKAALNSSEANGFFAEEQSNDIKTSDDDQYVEACALEIRPVEIGEKQNAVLKVKLDGGVIGDDLEENRQCAADIIDDIIKNNVIVPNEDGSLDDVNGFAAGDDDASADDHNTEQERQRCEEEKKRAHGVRIGSSASAKRDAEQLVSDIFENIITAAIEGMELQ